MAASLDGLFGTITRLVPPELIAPAGLQAIDRLNSRLPARLATIGGFECPLGTPDAAGDWQLCVTTSGKGRETLAGGTKGAEFSLSLGDTPAWRQIRELARRWADPASRLHQRVDRLWLEFDRTSLAGEAPVPSVFVSLHPRSGSLPPADSLGPATLEALQLLNGAPLDPVVVATLRASLEQLPPGAIPAYVALMLSRDPRAVRLVAGLSGETLLPYLSQIGWPGSEAELMALISQVTPLVDGLFFNLDIGATVLPKIGVECHLRNKLPRAEPRWPRLLDLFVQLGLCLPRKRDLLLAWPGHQRAVLPDELWPVYLHRGLHHLKVVLQPGAPREAKGYLNVWQTSLLDAAS